MPSSRYVDGRYESFASSLRDRARRVFLIYIISQSASRYGVFRKLRKVDGNCHGNALMNRGHEPVSTSPNHVLIAVTSILGSKGRGSAGFLVSGQVLAFPAPP